MPADRNTSDLDDSAYSDSEHDLPPLLQEYNVQYRKYIGLVDKLRAFGLESELPLPRVAVIGVQSCGKSSVLEGISGVCLPRGTGTVTRCPVELQMKFNPNPQSDWEGRLFYQDDSGKAHNKILHSPASVAGEVVEAQRFLAGDHNVSNKPITLEIRSHHVPDLTLIDLPGLIEVPMPNQPDDLPDMIYELVRDYIATQETIIMVVAACNTEIATTKALKMANEVDQSGIRTLGVLTKPDLVDRGTEDDVMQMVTQPERFRIRKGFTVVKLRSQADVMGKLSLEQAHQNESKFFDEHGHYRRLPKEKVGTQSLSEKLTQELVTRIKEVLPALREETQTKLMESEKALQKLGGNVPTDEKDRQHFLTDSLIRYATKVCRICDGIYDADVETDQRLLFWTRPVMKEFSHTIEKMCPRSDDRELLGRIAKEIREQRGMELPGFLPYKACQVVIIKLLKEFMHVPSKTCLFKYNTCVETFLAKIAEEKFGQFPNLVRAVKLKVDELQRKAFKKCDESIEENFSIEYMVLIPDLLFEKEEKENRANHNIRVDGTMRRREEAREENSRPRAQEDEESRENIRQRPQEEAENRENGRERPQAEESRVNSRKRAHAEVEEPGAKKRKSKGKGRKAAAAESDIDQEREADPPLSGNRDTQEATTSSQPQHPPNMFPAAQRPIAAVPRPPDAVYEYRGRNEDTDFTMDKIVIYIRCALDRLMGSIPMKIHWYLIKRLSEQIQSHVTAMAIDPHTMTYLMEDEKTADIRRGLELRRDRLNEAHLELMKV